MEKLDKKTYRGIVKFTLESMLNLSKTDKNYNLAADTIYYYENTISRECRLKYLSQNHKGLKMSAATREKMAASRKKVPNSAEIQRMATEAAKKSPKSGRFITNKAAIDWHLVSPEGEHFHIHSLAFWLRENHEMFGVEPDTREFKNVISGLSRVKRAMLGKIGDGQRPCATYKGWSVIPTDYDLEKLKEDCRN